MRCASSFFALLISIALVLPASSQDQGEAQDPRDEQVEDAAEGSDDDESRFESLGAILDSVEDKDAEESRKARPAIARTKVSLPAEMSEEMESVYEAAVIAELRHTMWEMEHREKIYGWQHWAGIIVFLVAVGIVIAGMIMSWMQFRLAFAIGPEEPPAGPAAEAPAAEAPAAEAPGAEAPGGGDGGEVRRAPSKRRLLNPFSQSHGFEMSPGSVKLSTSFIGVVILALSLAFFYLYLKFVFVIS